MAKKGKKEEKGVQGWEGDSWRGPTPTKPLIQDQAKGSK